jgi:hypothetical protein
MWGGGSYTRGGDSATDNTVPPTTAGWLSFRVPSRDWLCTPSELASVPDGCQRISQNLTYNRANCWRQVAAGCSLTPPRLPNTWTSPSFVWLKVQCDWSKIICNCGGFNVALCIVAWWYISVRAISRFIGRDVRLFHTHREWLSKI